jgi:DNA-nicking Smr family endonuclease
VKKKPFHAPFEKLSGLRKKLDPPSTPPRPAPPPAPPVPRAKTEEELWAEATSGARRVDPGAGQVPRHVPRGLPERVWYPDLDAIDELRALVSGDAPFDIGDGDEFIEGWVPGLDAGIVRKLRRGEYAVQAHLDLHGLTREEARVAVERFLRASRMGGKRCVLLVHGRGLHSREQLPILKEALRGWLSTNRFGRHVLAFATARPADGGAGALYVLLRRAGR